MPFLAHEILDLPPLSSFIYCIVKSLNSKYEHTELLGFWTLSIVRILIVTRKKKNKHNVSETGSVSVLR
jgi:hypothetical protein